MAVMALCLDFKDWEEVFPTEVYEAHLYNETYYQFASDAVGQPSTVAR